MKIDSSKQQEMGRSVRAAAALPLYKHVLFFAAESLISLESSN